MQTKQKLTALILFSAFAASSALAHDYEFKGGYPNAGTKTHIYDTSG